MKRLFSFAGTVTCLLTFMEFHALLFSLPFPFLFPSLLPSLSPSLLHVHGRAKLDAELKVVCSYLLATQESTLPNSP